METDPRVCSYLRLFASIHGSRDFAFLCATSVLLIPRILEIREDIEDIDNHCSLSKEVILSLSYWSLVGGPVVPVSPVVNSFDFICVHSRV